MTIMLVENNSGMRRLIKDFLLDHLPDLESVYEEARGDSAIVCYQQHRPDWVTMDIHLEGLDGFEATKAILNDDPDAKIVILTNFNYKEYKAAALKSGARAFLLKEHLDMLPRILKSKDLG